MLAAISYDPATAAATTKSVQQGFPAWPASSCGDCQQRSFCAVCSKGMGRSLAARWLYKSAQIGNTLWAALKNIL